MIPVRLLGLGVLAVLMFTFRDQIKEKINPS